MVKAFLLKHMLRALAPDSEVTARLNLPNEWVVCSFCGEAGWGVHPHYGHPCPIVAAMSESAGMKIDADRSSTIRAGLHLEEMTRIVRDHFGLEDEDLEG